MDAKAWLSAYGSAWERKDTADFIRLFSPGGRYHWTPFETPREGRSQLVYMPLARYALTAWGEQIHVAPTWDRGEPWMSTVRHIAKEGRCFVLSVCQAFHKDDIPDTLEFKAEYLDGVDGWINPGLSLIVDPDGKVVAGPLEAEEGILYADVHPDQLVGPRWQLDTAGHYARPDVFELRVHREPRPPLVELDRPPREAAESESGGGDNSDGSSP